MRLIELYANQSSFKRVRFNEVGPSFILGSKQDKNSHGDDGKSYNGVGKSLLIEIVHFCLGSNSNKAFKESLPEWEFTLVIGAAGKHYSISRSANKQNEVYFNEKKLTVKALNENLQALSFNVPAEATGQLSFRSLIGRFIRRRKEDYSDPRETSSDNEPFTTLIRNLFLLGLDISLAEKKYALRSRQTQLEAFEKNFKSDPYIKEFYTGNKDVALQASHLEERARALESDLSEFKVAEDYYDIEQSANDISAELRQLKNKRAVLDNAVRNIDKSLELKTDITFQKIKDVYDEMLSAFKPETLKSLDDIEKFHASVVQKRSLRLNQEKERIEAEISTVSESIKRKIYEVDQKLSYLSDKRALDQYAGVASELSDVRARLQKLRDYRLLLQKSQEEMAQLKIHLAEEDIKTNAYLESTERERNERLSIFSKLAKEIYPNALAGITLRNNSGENKLRYDFDVRVEADSSDGIGAVKLFCYDLTLAVLRSNSNVKFIWHDSRLFSDIDPRQRALLFKLASEISKDAGFQYIASINEDQLETVKEELSSLEYEELLDHVILRLDDRGADGKLLGKQVDMSY